MSTTPSADRLFDIVKTDLPGLLAAAEDALRGWESREQP
jgi:hypothetical protein